MPIAGIETSIRDGVGPGSPDTRPDVRPLVLKIGGSVAEAGKLAPVLAMAAAATRPLVIVPGGGPFADAVREAQKQAAFSDAAAHRMAMLAMHQMAEVYFAKQTGLVPAETEAAIRAAWGQRQTPVWLPLAMATSERIEPEDWSNTSDGLAAWLARRLGGEVALMKSCAVARGASPEALASAGVTDPVFARIVAEAGLQWRMLGPGEEAALRVLLEARNAVDAAPGAC